MNIHMLMKHEHAHGYEWYTCDEAAATFIFYKNHDPKWLSLLGLFSQESLFRKKIRIIGQNTHH